jgi:hypothetical protein
MAASPTLTGIPEIASSRMNQAPGLGIDYALIDAASIFCLALLHLLLVVEDSPSRGVSGVEWWSSEKALRHGCRQLRAQLPQLAPSPANHSLRAQSSAYFRLSDRLRGD